MANKKVQNTGQANQGGKENPGNKGTTTSGDSKKEIASIYLEEQKEISSKRGKPAAEKGNRIESNSSGIQLNKSSSKNENQGRSNGLGKRMGPQGKEGNR